VSVFRDKPGFQYCDKSGGSDCHGTLVAGFIIGTPRGEDGCANRGSGISRWMLWSQVIVSTHDTSRINLCDVSDEAAAAVGSRALH
jgi:hypothetical protein